MNGKAYIFEMFFFSFNRMNAFLWSKNDLDLNTLLIRTPATLGDVITLWLGTP
jgi:hypothetical protein